MNLPRSVDEVRKALLPRWATNVLVLLGAGLVGFLVWTLADQNRQLREALAAGNAPAEATPIVRTLQPVPLEDIEGNAVLLTEVLEGHGVVAFFTTTCPYCEENLPSWNELYASLASQGVPMVGISLHPREQTERYLGSRNVPWPAYVLAETADPLAVGIRSVPFTIVADANGAITDAWRGVLTSATLVAIGEAAFEAR